MKPKQLKLEIDLDRSEEELNDDDREAEFNDDDLPLFYHPFHRDILRLSVQHNLSITDRNTYDYIALNYSVLGAQSHPIQTKDIADFLQTSIRTIQRSLKRLKEIGLLREQGFNERGTIYALPYREKARDDAHEMRRIKRDKKIAEEVDLLVAEREAAVQRELYPHEIEHIREHIEKKFKVSSNGKHTNGSEGDLPKVEELPFS